MASIFQMLPKKATTEFFNDGEKPPKGLAFSVPDDLVLLIREAVTHVADKAGVARSKVWADWLESHRADFEQMKE